MTIWEYRSRFIASLSQKYGADEASSFFNLVLEKLHGISRIKLALMPEMQLSADLHEKWESILRALHDYKPIQYILGEAHFAGNVFKVDKSVLIPRPETEELVEFIERSLPKGFSGRILDIGTGSGCIAISLALRFPGSTVTAVDVSPGALRIARENAAALNANVIFQQCDILAAAAVAEADIIVSNPPYVRELEKSEIKPNVLANEPHLALFVADNDALLFYRKISNLALAALSENGMLFFEINQYLGPETMQMLLEKGFSAELCRDIYGKDRMIRATRNEALR